MNKIFLSFLLCLIFPQFSLAYDDQTTHPGLTEQTVEFYNLNNNIKISPADKEFIIQGSIDEDSAGRPLNHFYDPVNSMGINDYRTAIDWATGENTGNDFSWSKSIEKYAQGDKEGALIGLGHILHLIQDMTVPDHTRNDPHMGEGGVASLTFTGDSVYEKWAKENKNRETLQGTAVSYKNSGLQPKTIVSIEDYLENIAIYSNNNYVSPDTIDGSAYQNPKVIKKMNGYAYGEDTSFHDEHKLYIEKYYEKYGVRKILIDKESEDFSVLSEYFTRLSKIAILSGTGVAELFFQEAERARADYLQVEKEKQEAMARREAERNQKLATSGFWGKIWYGIGYTLRDTAISFTQNVYNVAYSLGSTFYNGSALVFNQIENGSSLANFTVDRVATIGVKKIEEGVRTVERAVVSASKKAILYIQENNSNLMAPAVVYRPPVQSPDSVNLSQEDLSRLLTILSTANNSSDNNNNNQDQASDDSHHHGGHSDSAPVTEETEGEEEISTTTASTTEEIVVAIIDPIIEEETATSTDPLATSTEEISDLATSTEEIATTTTDIATTIDVVATTTATTTEPVIDTEAPEFSLALSEPCLNTSQTDICLLATTTVDFIFLASSTDIAFYTIDIDDGDILATTSESFFSLDLERDNIYPINFSATDLAGNISATTSLKIDIRLQPVIIKEVWWSYMFGHPQNIFEQIYLHNNTTYDISLNNWSLVTDTGLFNLSLQKEIKAEADFGLSGDSPCFLNQFIHQCYSEELDLDSEILNLFYSTQKIFDLPIELECVNFRHKCGE